jgi:hypothetical protein
MHTAFQQGRGNQIMRMVEMRAEHLTSVEVAKQMHKAWNDGDMISDRVAVTIASWWQSPGTVGRHLAALASGVPVIADDLIEDIANTIDTTPDLSPDEYRQLFMLRDWVLYRD